MNFGVAFAPLVPESIVWAAAIAALVISVLLLVSRSRGAGALLAALLVFVLALANPSFPREDREPLSSVVAVVVDKSPSQELGDRNKQTAQAQTALVDSLKKIKGLEVR